MRNELSTDHHSVTLYKSSLPNCPHSFWGDVLLAQVSRWAYDPTRYSHICTQGQKRLHEVRLHAVFLTRSKVKVYSIRIPRCGHAINLVSSRIYNILHTIFDVFVSFPEGRRGGKKAVNQVILWLTKLRSNATFVNAYLARRILQIAPVRSVKKPVGNSKWSPSCWPSWHLMKSVCDAHFDHTQPPISPAIWYVSRKSSKSAKLSYLQRRTSTTCVQLAGRILEFDI